MRHISLVGMSNVGKTHHSNQLADLGFEVFHIDDLIEKELDPELKKEGLRGIADMAKWMGHPFEPQYSRNSQRYLELEEKYTFKGIKAAVLAPAGKRVAIDTTGSVVYLPMEILNNLRGRTRVICLETPDDQVATALERFIEHPKPVCWGTDYQPAPDEVPMDAVKRCYPKLLATRRQLYRMLAHATIPWDTHKHPDYTAQKLLGDIDNNPRATT